MASGLNPILACQGKVNASNALVVTGTGTGTTVTPTGGPQAIGTLQGKVDSSNRLVVIFV